jgi:ectoine hydroxylase-related dioxygenase (phytanoyl-CoA dioxygenase family)
MVLTESQHHGMANSGFTIFEGLFSADQMSRLGEQIEHITHRHEFEMKTRGGFEGISRVDEIVFTAHLAEQNDAILAFCRDPHLAEIVQELLGKDTDLYWNQSVYKKPEGEREFPWHQDDGYTPVVPSPYLTVWLAINDATLENGCIHVIPGSHLGGLRKHEPTPIGLQCEIGADDKAAVPVPLKAGSVAVFWSLTVHKSGINRSLHTRKAFIMQYCPAGLRFAKTGEEVPNLRSVTRGGIAVYDGK